MPSLTSRSARRRLNLRIPGACLAALLLSLSSPAAPDYSLVGFATLNGFSTNFDAGGTSGGLGGAHVQVWNATNLLNYLQRSNTMRLMVEVMTNLDLGVPGLTNGIDQPLTSSFLVGRINISSNKTVYSKNGATLQHGMLTVLSGAHNVIIRNLKFRDLWEFDPTGNYDTLGWDYVRIDTKAHHVWVDHCDFQTVYDGMVDITHGSDFVTVSWNVFRDQLKGSLVGHSDSNKSEDTNHLNVTFHHNYYTNVDERMPRMRFGNAHVFNLYCERLTGKAIQSCAGAATLIENVWFTNNAGGTPLVLSNSSALAGTAWVTNSVGITTTLNKPGFVFNFPFNSSQPPYVYSNVLHAVTDVPAVVKNYSGVGKVGFELWQMEQFTPTQLTNSTISGPDAAPAGDGVPNLVKYALGLLPFAPATNALTSIVFTNGNWALSYQRPATATDVTYEAQVSTDLLSWTDSGVSQQLVNTDANGLQTWNAFSISSGNQNQFFRLQLIR